MNIDLDLDVVSDSLDSMHRAILKLGVNLIPIVVSEQCY